jgi:cytochrome b subunit of formate dehydrogenase
LRDLKPNICLFVITLFFTFPAFAQDDMCESCHDDPGLDRVVGGIPASLYVNSGMIGNSVHKGLSCTDCHTSLEKFEDFPHAENLPGVNCADCHTDAFEQYMSGFYEHLVQRGFTTIPGCTQCHGDHNITHDANTNIVCGICHREQRKQFESSIHYSEGHKTKGISCTNCHSAHEKTERGNMLPEDWRLFIVDKCLSCHKDHSEEYLSSKHYEGVKKKNPKAPVCIDCHDTHSIYSVEDKRSKVNIDKLDATCDRCHPGHESTIHRKSDADPRLMTCVACHTGHRTQMDKTESTIFKETLPFTCNRCHEEDRHKKENLAHGKIMLVAENGEPANCTKCHIYHWRISDQDHLGESQSRMQCVNCHPKENADYERSVHGLSSRKGHAEAPVCVTCHGDREVERISSRFDGQTVISLCSSCHGDNEITMKFQLNPNVISGYLGTYHGQVYSLGYQGREFATCTSCHDNHLILPSDNPQSSISKQHIVETCGRCHKDSNENFVSMLQHYDPMLQEQNIILSVIHTFMVWLLGVTLSIFSIHTILWLIRALIDRIKHGPRKIDKEQKKVRYKRFGLYERILHGIVIVSFLLLAMTGLPLKYSQSEASQWVASHILNLHTMAILHRIGAGLTFIYFLLHLSKLGYKLVSKQSSFLKLFWGEDSLVPQPRDAVQFVQHIGYFIGVTNKPSFGRWSYWEKFDYFAVFWGVAIIGLSGLTLWFPEFFTQILPGWAINAAHIIHSEEALLATGFIFTIHFFNEHLRPENFPLDEVIFTGSVSEHYMKHERTSWFKQLEEQGKLESIKVAPMKLWARAILYLCGFLALGVGLALLVLIVIGTFF